MATEFIHKRFYSNIYLFMTLVLYYILAEKNNKVKPIEMTHNLMIYSKTLLIWSPDDKKKLIIRTHENED